MDGKEYSYIKLVWCCIFLIPIVFLSGCSRPAPAQPIKTSTQNKNQNTVPALKINLDEKYTLKFKSGIRHILEDSKGNIWIASDKEGVCKYDGTSFTYYDYEDGLCSNQIRTIYEHANGQVWFEGGYGLSYFNGEEIITPKDRNYSDSLQWKNPEGALWFKPDASTGHSEDEGGIGVYCYDGESLNYHLFPIHRFNPLEPFGKIDSWGYSVSTNFVRTKAGPVLFGTYNAVIVYDGKKLTIMDNDYLGLANDLKVNNGLHIRALFEDSKGTLWIGNNGIGILKQEGDQFINFSEQKGLTSANSAYKGITKKSTKLLEHVFAIGEDKEGNMWFGDRDTGAWRYDGRTMKNYSYMDGLTCTHIWHIYSANNGELWFAMDDGNILKFEDERFVKVF